MEDIFVISEVSDFIKLIKEAEFLYELGFYTGCIALVGIAAEDFTKYIVIKNGKNKYLNLSQFQRINKIHEEEIIDKYTHKSFDNIRKLRNGCLHYKKDFKKKNESDLKNEALQAINNIKSIIKHILGIKKQPTPDEFLNIITSILNSSKIDNDETIYKMRNAVSVLLKVPLAFDPSQKITTKKGFFLVGDVDIKNREITLIGIKLGIPVIVDLNDYSKNIIINQKIKKDDQITASIYSVINKFGMSAIWNFYYLQKR